MTDRAASVNVCRLEHDADGLMIFDGYVRIQCTGDGCTTVPYVEVGTDQAIVLCHECTSKRAKENKMAAKKKTTSNGAKATDGGEYVERDRYEEALPVKIAQDVADERARTLAAVVHDHDALLERKRDMNAGFREKISFYRERMKELSESVKACTELRPVTCIERLNVRQNAVEVVRLDTGEVLSSRAATAEDRQEPLTGIDGGKSSKRKKAAKDEAPALPGIDGE